MQQLSYLSQGVSQTATASEIRHAENKHKHHHTLDLLYCPPMKRRSSATAEKV